MLAFASAHENFLAGSRHGIDAEMFWPGVGQMPASELILRHLLPLAHEGLDAWGTDPDIRDRLLGVVEARCKTGLNGAEWQTKAVRAFEAAARAAGKIRTEGKTYVMQPGDVVEFRFNV